MGEDNENPPPFPYGDPDSGPHFGVTCNQLKFLYENTQKKVPVIVTREVEVKKSVLEQTSDPTIPTPSRDDFPSGPPEIDTRTRTIRPHPDAIIPPFSGKKIPEYAENTIVITTTIEVTIYIVNPILWTLVHLAIAMECDWAEEAKEELERLEEECKEEEDNLPGRSLKLN